jgi:hypothetical protein
LLGAGGLLGCGGLGAGEDVDAEVAAAFGPFIVLFGEVGCTKDLGQGPLD